MSEPKSPPRKGARVELKGLVSKPELNGRGGVVISKYDPKTGRCGVRLEDGTGVNAKLSNIVVVTAELRLERSLARLREAGGTEEEPDDDDSGDGSHANPADYLDELMAVGDARYDLGHYDRAAGCYYRAYYATMHKDNCINNPELFPVAHKMLLACSKSCEEMSLRMGHGMAQQTLMIPGCPPYIRQDMKNIEKAMRRMGVEVEDMMGSLRRNFDV